MLIGAVINWVAVLVLFDVSASFATVSTVLFFGLSFIRSFLIRIAFRKTE